MPLTYVKSKLRQVLFGEKDLLAGVNREVVPTLAELVRRFNELSLLDPTDTKTSTYAAVAHDFVVCNPSSGAFSVTLTDVEHSRQWIGGVTISSSNYVTFLPPAGHTINGQASYQLQGLYAAVVFIRISSTAWAAFAEGLPTGAVDQALIWNGDAWVPTTINLGTDLDAVPVRPIGRGGNNAVVSTLLSVAAFRGGMFLVPTDLTFNSFTFRTGATINFGCQLCFAFYQNNLAGAWNGTLEKRGEVTMTPTANTTHRVAIADTSLLRGYAVATVGCVTATGDVYMWDSSADANSVLLGAHPVDQFGAEFTVGTAASAMPATIVPADITSGADDLVCMLLENR